MLFKLAFKPLEQREGIGGTAREAGDDLLLIKPAHLARITFEDGIAHRDLAVAANHDITPAAYRQDGSTV